MSALNPHEEHSPEWLLYKIFAEPPTCPDCTCPDHDAPRHCPEHGPPQAHPMDVCAHGQET